MKKIILLLLSVAGLFLLYGCSSEYYNEMEYEYQEEIQNLESQIYELNNTIEYKEQMINDLESQVEELEEMYINK